MSPHGHAAFSYQSVATESRANGSHPVELVVMLYDALAEALGQINKITTAGLKHPENAIKLGRQISRAQVILAGLRETLDFTRGECVARQLFEFYNDLSMGLLQFQRTKNVTLVVQLQRAVEEVAGAWRQLGHNHAAVRPGSVHGATGSTGLVERQPEATAQKRTVGVNASHTSAVKKISSVPTEEASVSGRRRQPISVRA